MVTNSSYPPFHPEGPSRQRSMTSEQFETAFADESSFVEWKTGISRKQIQRAIVAFSNADGGVLMLGVDDDGRPTGKPLDAGLEKTL